MAHLDVLIADAWCCMLVAAAWCCIVLHDEENTKTTCFSSRSAKLQKTKKHGRTQQTENADDRNK